MSKEFVVLTEQDFITWANDTFGADSFQMTLPKNGLEVVIRYAYPVHGMELHIYTTCERRNNQTRAVGEDAIRIILYDRFAGKMAYQEAKILRVTGDTTVFERLTERVNNVNKIVTALQKQDRFCKCKENRVHTVKRTRNSDQATFYGCSIYNLCKSSSFLKIDHARKQYPLIFNPFEDLTVPKSDDIKPVAAKFKSEEYVETPKVKTKYQQWEVELDSETIPTKDWTLVHYPFERFNKVQTTVLKSEVWDRDCNVVLGTATSSGKTICAELAIARILNS